MRQGNSTWLRAFASYVLDHRPCQAALPASCDQPFNMLMPHLEVIPCTHE